MQRVVRLQIAKDGAAMSAPRQCMAQALQANGIAAKAMRRIERRDVTEVHGDQAPSLTVSQAEANAALL